MAASKKCHGPDKQSKRGIVAGGETIERSELGDQAGRYEESW